MNTHADPRPLVLAALDDHEIKYRGRNYQTRVSRVRVVETASGTTAQVQLTFTSRSTAPIATMDVPIDRVDDTSYLRRRALGTLKLAVDGEVGLRR